MTTKISDRTATHLAFGLRWHLPFPFPAFPAAPAGQAADVLVEEGDLPSAAGEVRACGPLREAGPAVARIGLPGVARLLITDGNRIRVKRHDGCSDDALNLLLMGTGAALLLHQRGYLPLHGSGILTARGAVLFVGHSGAGKSTTLAALMQRGYPMICDDLAAIRLNDAGMPQVWPGVGVYKLWADSAEALGLGTADLPRVRAELEKFMVPTGANLVTQAAPVRAIYQLATHNRPELSMKPRRDSAKFNALLDHTWQKLTIKRMGLHTEHFSRAVAVANAVRVVSIRRPDGGGLHPGDLADRLEADFLS
ncbi:hypothetical protein F2Q65_02450 [Thiohalocapsa marina]|uniref:Serine kinase n=1 Tax=Thiohalocapsa marina TaxID=424902 RepID=A0A5M8FUC0_9GAMM|nr:hypothetical protein [Thiohalocapsa marina]KAA6187402.1 hypothetical protein F2Q65_02450 [Thiohalocapsa marina]